MKSSESFSSPVRPMVLSVTNVLPAKMCSFDIIHDHSEYALARFETIYIKLLILLSWLNANWEIDRAARWLISLSIKTPLKFEANLR